MSSVPSQCGTSASGNLSRDKYNPGKVIAVGKHKTEIINYIAEGGFAQIYSVKFVEYLNEFGKDSKAITSLKIGNLACLKRVIVHDENGLNELRNEVEVMKKLKGAANVVEYYDSNASRLNDGSAGFEVLLLMELCPNGSLLDYMNQRLATKLSEKEVLKVMYDVSLGLSQMHYLAEPLLHRDIKIENVLVDAQNNFKLCDFGSTSKCFPIVTTHKDIAMLTQNIYVHTTPQYRSPEMIDIYRYLPINEKSDIWALGVFLYKLLFFTTPFEMTGQFAILHSKYEMPVNNFSSKLNNLIIIMLSENPNLRPNVYQIIHQICSIMGEDVPIKDAYEAGPYNFEHYTHFQNKLQTIQYQMFELEKKKIENKGKVTQSDNNLINDLFMSSFDIASKIPCQSKSTSPSTLSVQTNNNGSTSSDILESVTPEPSSEATKQTHSDDRLSRHTSQNVGSNKTYEKSAENAKSISEKLENVDINANRKENVKKENSEKYFPTVGELNSYMDREMNVSPDFKNDVTEKSRLTAPVMDQRQTSYGSAISDSKTTASNYQTENLLNQERLARDSQLVSEHTIGTSKHYKSNNPFPKMGYEQPSNQQQQQQNTNPFPQVQTPVDNVNYLHRNKAVETPIHAQNDKNKANKYSVSDHQARVPVFNQNAGNQIQNREYVAQNQQSQFQPNYTQPKDTSVIKQNQIRINQQVPNKMVQQVSYHQPSSIPVQSQPRIRHQSQPINILDSVPLGDSSEGVPPQIPPHPRRKENLLDDLSSPRISSNKTNEDKSKFLQPHNGRHTQSHQSTRDDDMNRSNKYSGVRRSMSLNKSPRALQERPTTESIDIDLDALKRKSLDLKLAQSRFISSDLKDQSIQEDEVLDNHGHRDTQLDRHQFTKKNASNGSIPGLTENSREMNNSITKTRQSLDLDRTRREYLVNSDIGNKRRSIFSMFRADKK